MTAQLASDGKGIEVRMPTISRCTTPHDFPAGRMAATIAAFGAVYDCRSRNYDNAEVTRWAAFIIACIEVQGAIAFDTTENMEADGRVLWSVTFESLIAKAKMRATVELNRHGGELPKDQLASILLKHVSKAWFNMVALDSHEPIDDLIEAGLVQMLGTRGEHSEHIPRLLTEAVEDLNRRRPI